MNNSALSITVFLKHLAGELRTVEKWTQPTIGYVVASRDKNDDQHGLAQEPDELSHDEPTNHLDITHQLDLLTLVSELPITSYIAMHDLNLAAVFCDRVVVLARGSVVAVGTPAEVITEELVEHVYSVRAHVTVEDGVPQVRYGRSAGGSADAFVRESDASASLSRFTPVTCLPKVRLSATKSMA